MDANQAGGTTNLGDAHELGAACARYTYGRGGHELVLSLEGATDRQAADVARSEAEFALGAEGPLILFCYRFGETVPWSGAAPLRWHDLLSEERAGPPDLGPASGGRDRTWTTLRVTLVDRADGCVRARRAVALRPEFTRVLRHLIRDQAACPPSDAACEFALDRLRRLGDPPMGAMIIRTGTPAASSARPGHPGGAGPIPKAGRREFAPGPDLTPILS